jgi:hypothetical protein
LFSSDHSIFFVSFVLRVCPGYDFVMIIVPHDLSADRWLDVSFVLDGFLGIWVMMDWDEGTYTGLEICLRTFSIARLRVDDDGNFDMINRRYKAASLCDRCNC